MRSSGLVMASHMRACEAVSGVVSVCSPLQFSREETLTRLGYTSDPETPIVCRQTWNMVSRDHETAPLGALSTIVLLGALLAFHTSPVYSLDIY